MVISIIIITFFHWSDFHLFSPPVVLHKKVMCVRCDNHRLSINWFIYYYLLDYDTRNWHSQRFFCILSFILHWLSAAMPIHFRSDSVFYFFCIYSEIFCGHCAECLFPLYLWIMNMIYDLCSSHCIHRKSQSNHVAGRTCIEWNGFAHSFISFQFIHSTANNRIRSISHL